MIHHFAGRRGRGRNIRCSSLGKRARIRSTPVPSGPSSNSETKRRRSIRSKHAAQSWSVVRIIGEGASISSELNRRSSLLSANHTSSATVAAGGDSGSPVALDDPDADAASVFHDLVETIVSDVAPPVEIAECSLRGTLLRAGADIEGARERAQARG